MENTLMIKDQDIILNELWEHIELTHNVGNGREARNVMFRHGFLVAARDLTKLSLKAIGNIQGKDHATVLHAIRNHQQRYNMEKMYREIYNSIYEVMVKAVSDHDDDVAELLERRFQKMSAEDFDTMLSQTYKSKLERAEKTYATKIEQMNKEITILRKHLKTNKERADLLNSELIRIKNLL